MTAAKNTLEFARDQGEGVPEVSLEELQAYLEKNPDETFDLEASCGCLLHNYLAKTQPVNHNSFDSGYEVNEFGVGAKKQKGDGDSYVSVAKLPGGFASLLKQKLDTRIDWNWHPVDVDQMKGILDCVKTGDLSQAGTLLDAAIRIPPEEDEDEDDDTDYEE